MKNMVFFYKKGGNLLWIFSTRFLLFCDETSVDSAMESVIQDIKNESKDLWDNYSTQLDGLINRISDDTEESLEHALGKHANVYTADEYDNHKKPISYFDSRKDLLKFCSDLIRRENLTFYISVFKSRMEKIVIEGKSQMRIGTVRQKDKEIGTMYVRVIIGVEYDGREIKSLKLHSVYPIPYHGFKSFNKNNVDFKKL